MQDDTDTFVAEALGRLAREKDPPAALEHATVASLKTAGLLRSGWRTRISVTRWALAAGIAVVAFAGGSQFASRGSAGAATSPQPTFALILYGGGSLDDSATHYTRAAEYGRWARADHGASMIVGGEALGLSVAALSLVSVSRTTDSVIVQEPARDVDDPVGYFLVHAPDRDAAVWLAKTCPHLRYGGRVVVQQVWGAPAATVASAASDTQRQ